MSARVFYSTLATEHVTPPGHPERVERWEAMRGAAIAAIGAEAPLVAGRVATEAEIALVHDAAYIAQIRETSGRAVALDPDTFTSPRTYDAALAAVGTALSAVEHVLDGTGPPRALALVRPPGHHAESARAMGFCVFNNVAVAAARARAAGIARVAIVDFDVHHGNGTQASFYDDPAVLFISTHQHPFYPGTGIESEVGAGAGKGFTVNVPLAAGCTDVDYDIVFQRVVVPVLQQYAPQLVLVSAGFDAHADDPLGGMRLTSAAFGRFTATLREVADAHASGRLVLVTEGGYNLAALAESVRAVVHAIAEPRPTLRSSPPTPLPTTLSAPPPTPSSTRPPAVAVASSARADAALARVLPQLRPYWRL